MKKYKLIKALAIGAPIAITPLLAASCGSKGNGGNKPNPVPSENKNISTWGTPQKNEIIAAYLNGAQTWYNKSTSSKKWLGWTTGDDEIALEAGFKAVNSDADLNGINRNITFKYNDAPGATADVEAALKTGVTAVFTGEKDGFTGSLTITFKGDINNSGDKYSSTNLSSYGDVQKEIISAAYIEGAQNWYDKALSSKKWLGWTTGDDEKALEAGFQQINETADLNGVDKNISFAYNDPPGATTDVASALQAGVSITFTATGGGFSGTLTLEIQGNIDT